MRTSDAPFAAGGHRVCVSFPGKPQKQGCRNRFCAVGNVYSNTLKVLEVTGKILRDALEQCATYFQPDAQKRVRIAPHFLEPKEAHYNYDYFAGISYAFDLARPAGSRVVELKRNGREIAPDEKLSLCMCDYRATGAGDFDFYRSCKILREIQTDVSELILNYLRAHPLVEIPAKRAFQVFL